MIDAAEAWNRTQNRLAEIPSFVEKAVMEAIRRGETKVSIEIAKLSRPFITSLPKALEAKGYTAHIENTSMLIVSWEVNQGSTIRHM